MDSLAEVYCRKYRDQPVEFADALFWRSLYWHARLAALLLFLVDSDYFAFERELIHRAGRTRSMIELREVLREHQSDVRSRNWWREVGLIRVDPRKLQGLAKESGFE